MQDVNITFAESYKPFIDAFYNDKYKELSLYGGRNSGKSTCMYILELLTIMSTGNVMVIRRYKNSIESSSYSGAIAAMNMLGIEDRFITKKSPMRIYSKDTGYSISYAGLDDPNKIKSSTSKYGAYKLLVFEEAQEILVYRQIEEAISTFNRGKDSLKGFKVVYLWNVPEASKSWQNEKLTKNDDYMFSMKILYTDIPEEWVGGDLLKIKRIMVDSPRLYRQMYLGESIGGASPIFENIHNERITNKQIEKWEDEDDFVFNGLDFGYTDPNAGVSVHYDVENEILYIYRELYGGNLTNKKLSDELEACGFNMDTQIIADSANTKDIEDLRVRGWNIIGVNKGGSRGSVKRDIKWLQSLHKIVIDKSRCKNVYREFSELSWEFDSNNNLKDIAATHQDNHSVDATRYALNKIIRSPGV